MERSSFVLRVETDAREALDFGQRLGVVGLGPGGGQLELQQHTLGVHEVEEIGVARLVGDMSDLDGLTPLGDERVAEETDAPLRIAEVVQRVLEVHGDPVVGVAEGSDRARPSGACLLLGGTVIAQLVHIGAMYTPWLGDVLGAEPVSFAQWLTLLGAP